MAVLQKVVTFVARHRINLSRAAPSEVGVPGARASIDMQGKTRIYGGRGRFVHK